MKLINLSWKECGYLGRNFWACSSAPAAEAVATAQALVRQVRQQAGVFRLRVTIHPHPLIGGKS